MLPVRGCSQPRERVKRHDQHSDPAVGRGRRSMTPKLLATEQRLLDRASAHDPLGPNELGELRRQAAVFGTYAAVFMRLTGRAPDDTTAQLFAADAAGYARAAWRFAEARVRYGWVTAEKG